MNRSPDADDAARFLAFQLRLRTALRRPPRWSWLLAAVLVAVGASTLVLGAKSVDGGALQVMLAAGVIPDKILQGQWWRVFTGTWLHQSWPHLMVNAIGLVLVGRYVEATFGGLRLWLIYATAALGGVVGTVVSGQTVSVGASGAVFGLVGALLAVGWRLRRKLSKPLRQTLIAIPAAVIGAALIMQWIASTGVASSQTDGWAHVFGALTGTAVAYRLVISLRDAGGELLVPRAPGRSRDAMWVVIGGAALFGAVMVAGVTAFPLIDEPIQIDVVNPQVVQVDNVTFRVPASYGSGVWREGRCDGELTGLAWALRSERIACHRLPLGGVLLIGRRNRLLTQDDGDFKAMRTANQSGEWTWRQAGVMLYPIAQQWLYIIAAPQALHPTYKRALTPLLPPRGQATISRPDPPGISATQP